MRYLIAILFPPLAVFMTGKIGLALLNFILTLLFYFPGLIHALFVINSHNNEVTLRAVTSKKKITEKNLFEIIKDTRKK